MPTVPVCSPSGKILYQIDAERASKLKGVELVRAGRRRTGAIVRVLLKPATNQVCPLIDRTGLAFLQILPDSGHRVYALRGVEGSR